MTSQRQYISKGFYERAQISDLVSVKEYIFVRHNEKKCLMLRFSNELNYVVNVMEFSVVQIDAAGKILETTKIKYSDLNFMPGTTYVDSSMIVVNEFCADFRIVFTEIISGRYKYTVRNGRYTVDYIKAEVPIIKNSSKTKRIKRFSIRPRRVETPRFAAFLATLVAFLLVLLCGYDVFLRYNPESNSEEPQSVEAELDNTAKGDGVESFDGLSEFWMV